MCKVTQLASGRHRVQPKPGWISALYQLHDRILTWPLTGRVTFSKFLHLSALPCPEILVELAGGTGMVGRGGWGQNLAGDWLQTGRLMEAFRTRRDSLGHDGVGFMDSPSVHEQRGRILPLFLPDRRCRCRKGLVQGRR